MRATIPNTVRWFTTLTQHPCFKGALGPVSMATAPFTPAGASSGGQGSSSNSKKPKEGKKGKPKKASKAGLPNGDAAGGLPLLKHCSLEFLTSACKKRLQDTQLIALSSVSVKVPGVAVYLTVPAAINTLKEFKETRICLCFACSGRAGEEKKKTKLGVSTKKADNFGAWYSEVVVEAELISYYDVSGEHGLPPFFLIQRICRVCAVKGM